jgi:TFIIF-interacting CTD phosphatase-like protein
MSRLCLLDLDHTLIYGSYAPSEKVELLFSYSEYLKVYKRPFVDEFINYVHTFYDTIIVYTTAKADYAHRICTSLKIDTQQILSREDCLNKKESFYKIFQGSWALDYTTIDIIDDSPNVWLNTEKFENKINFIVPKEFRGKHDDKELVKLMG